MRALLVAGVLAVVLPASAAAKLKPYIPPGNSGANEYVESVPSAGGDRSTGSVIASHDSGPTLAPSTQSALRSSGADGRATARAANATAPRRRHHGVQASVASGTGGAGSSGGGTGVSPTGGSPVGGVVQSLLGLQGQGGLGGALLAILIATMLALGAGRLWRRRTS